MEIWKYVQNSFELKVNIHLNAFVLCKPVMMTLQVDSFNLKLT